MPFIDVAYDADPEPMRRLPKKLRPRKLARDPDGPPPRASRIDGFRQQHGLVPSAPVTWSSYSVSSADLPTRNWDDDNSARLNPGGVQIFTASPNTPMPNAAIDPEFWDEWFDKVSNAARNYMQHAGKAFTDISRAFSSIDLSAFQGLVEPQPPSDPKARALWLRQNRNTGPVRPDVVHSKRPRKG